MVTEKSKAPAPTTSATDANAGNVVALPSKQAEARPSEKVIGFVKKHPILTAAGGIAAGAAIAALLPRKYTRGVTSKAAKFAEGAGASTLLLGKRAGKKAHDLGDDARDAAHLIGEKAEKASDFASAKLHKVGLAIIAAATAASKATAAGASSVSAAASDGSEKVVEMADKLRHRIKG